MRGRQLKTRTKKTGYIELVEFGMDDVKNTIEQRTSEIKDRVRKDLSNLTGDYLRDVIRGGYESVDPSQLQDLDEQQFDNVFKRVPEEILPEHDKTTLKQIIADINETGQIRDSNRVVAHFLTKLVELYKKQQVDEKDIRDFVEVCNKGYLSDKQIVYDDVTFDVSIVQYVESGHDHQLPMQALSSGEKQIVSLFSHLYLSGSSGFFVIIDEPELSLSVPWQRRFLPDILRRCNGLIAVTHSPFIYDNELKQYVHSLEEFTKPFEYDPDLEDGEVDVAEELFS